MRDLEIRTYTTYSIYDSDGEFVSGPFETQEALDTELRRLGYGEIVSHHPDGPDQVVPPPFVRDWLYPPGDARRSPQDRCSICGVKMPCDAQDHDVDAHLDAGPALDDWDGMPNR